MEAHPPVDGAASPAPVPSPSADAWGPSPNGKPPECHVPPPVPVAGPSGFRKRSPAAHYQRGVNNMGKWWERIVVALSPMDPRYAL